MDRTELKLANIKTPKYYKKLNYIKLVGTAGKHSQDRAKAGKDDVSVSRIGVRVGPTEMVHGETWGMWGRGPAGGRGVSPGSRHSLAAGIK